MTFASEFVARLSPALEPLGDRTRAIGARAYMKDIAPFIGVATPERRSLVKKIAKSMRAPSSEELGATARKLWKLEEREYQYCANDLVQIHWKIADKNFLAEHVEHLITTKSWWDTVDGLGSVAVSPMSDRYGCGKLIESWNNSTNIWLNRAAIQHQRGRGYETDTKLILRYCDEHSDSKEFFIVKAIGWALRDITAVDSQSVRRFLHTHPIKNSVAEREAIRGLKRA